PTRRCKRSLISSKSMTSSGCPYSKEVGWLASSAAPISCRRWRRGLAFVDVTEVDEVLRKAIVSNLRKLPWTAALQMVDVLVDRGVVNLWGVVRNEEEKNAIRVIAEETPGVQGQRRRGGRPVRGSADEEAARDYRAISA